MMRRKNIHNAHGPGSALPVDSTTKLGQAPTSATAVQPTVAPGRMSYDTYLKERSSLIGMEHKSAEQHDKAILTLAAGALALSVTFIEKIAPHPDPRSLIVLFFGWSALVYSIVAIINSFLASQKGFREQVRLIGVEYETGQRPEQVNAEAERTATLTFRGFASFVAGVILILAFSGYNLLALALRGEKPNPEIGEQKMPADDARKQEPSLQSVPSVPPTIKAPGIDPKSVKGGAVAPSAPVSERSEAAPPIPGGEKK